MISYITSISNTVNRHYLTSFLALLIAFQSVWVIADTHDLSQIDSVHIESKHLHDFPSSKSEGDIFDQNLIVPEQFPDDCQHCCHCHGQTSLALLNSNLLMQGVLPEKVVVHYPLDYSSHHLPSLFRPPII